MKSGNVGVSLGALTALWLAMSCAGPAGPQLGGAPEAMRDTKRTASAHEPVAEMDDESEAPAGALVHGAPVGARDGEREAGPLTRLEPSEVDRLTEADEDPAEEHGSGAAAAPAGDRDTFEPRAGDMSPEAVARETETEEAGAAAPASPSAARAGPKYQITLKNTFIEKYKNRATISAPYQVVHAGSIHAQADDGDQHVAGLCDEVGLACVAEVMNARDQDAAVNAMNSAEGGDNVQVYGAWRLWCEHPSTSPQVQDDPIPAYTNTNPDHVFEIHPVYRIDSTKFLGSLKPISGYAAKEAKKAFTYYESLRCRIEPESTTTTIFTDKAGYNYVEFVLRVDEDAQFITTDGRMVRCAALDLTNHEIVTNRRMVFIKDSDPEKKVKTMHKGGTMHVLGIPRIDLAVVSWRARNATTKPDALTWDLPYEIIVVGRYN